MGAPKELRRRPTCAICERPVASFTEETHESGALSGRVTFVAKCCGEVERLTVPRSVTRGMNFGIAFAHARRIAAAKPPALPPIPTTRRPS